MNNNCPSTLQAPTMAEKIQPAAVIELKFEAV
jgi:hypothetical protein